MAIKQDVCYISSTVKGKKKKENDKIKERGPQLSMVLQWSLKNMYFFPQKGLFQIVASSY